MAQVPPGERAALIDLYNATNGDEWSDRTGWLGPEGTECTWFGVGCIPGNPLVFKIELPSNNLVGTIPPTLPAFDNLVWLNLSGNSDLVGAIPEEIGSIGLVKLDLRYCGLEGSIPEALCGPTSSLNHLLLSGNELSGSIPSCLWDMPVLQELHLSSNNLTGELPQTLTLDGSPLRELGLADNGFAGAIPPGIGSAPLLEGLYLNENLFSGPLPASFGDLSGLTNLSVRGNRLVGKVPAEITQLTNINSGHFTFGYNGLDTDDASVEAFLESHDSYWQREQTIPPLDLAQIESTGTSVTVNWTPRGRIDPDSNFEFHIAPEGTDDWRVVDRPLTMDLSEWTIHGLEPGRQYRFRARVISDRRSYFTFYWCDLQPSVVGMFSPEIALATTAIDDSWYVAADAPPGGDCLSPATACASIQQAVDLAGTNDRVAIAPGVYSEQLTISGSVHLEGDGPAVIVDTRGSGRAVTVHGGGQVRLERLTIRGGPAEPGGAVLVDGSSMLQVTNCRIEDSSADRGAGIAVSFGSVALIEETNFSGGVAADAGGAIATEGTTIVRGCVLEGNSALSGGGIAQLDRRLRVYDTIIEANEAEIGGGIWVSDGLFFVQGSAVVANSAHHGGGVALVIASGALGPIKAYFNASTLSENRGGALLSAWTPDVCLADTTITGNIPWQTRDSGVTAFARVYAKGSVISGNSPLDCNGSVVSLGFNADGDGSCGLDDATDLSGVDVRLSELGRHGGRTPSHTPLSGSPLIDAGNPRAAWDQSGRDRSVDGSGDGLASPDIGAVEAVGAVFIDGFESGGTRWWATFVGGR